MPASSGYSHPAQRGQLHIRYDKCGVREKAEIQSPNLKMENGFKMQKSCTLKPKSLLSYFQDVHLHLLQLSFLISKMGQTSYKVKSESTPTLKKTGLWMGAMVGRVHKQRWQRTGIMSASGEAAVWCWRGSKGDVSFPRSTKCLSWMWKEHHSDMKSRAVSEKAANVELGRLGHSRWLSLANSSLPPHKV